MVESNEKKRSSRKEKVTDRLLTLYLYNKISKVDKMHGITKLQKLVFLCEKDMMEDDTYGYNYHFYRYKYGPMSNGVYNDYEYFQSNNLITEDTLKISTQGKEVLNEVEGIVDQNQPIFSYIDTIVEKFGGLSGSQLIDKVYDMRVTPLNRDRSLRIEDIKKLADIYLPLPESLSGTHIEIDEEWIETIDIMMSEKTRVGLSRDIEQAQRSESSPVELKYVE